MCACMRRRYAALHGAISTSNVQSTLISVRFFIALLKIQYFTPKSSFEVVFRYNDAPIFNLRFNNSNNNLTG